MDLAKACPLAPGPGCLDVLGSKASPLRSPHEVTGVHLEPGSPSSGTWPPFSSSSLMAASGSRGPRPPHRPSGVGLGPGWLWSRAGTCSAWNCGVQSRHTQRGRTSSA